MFIRYIFIACTFCSWQLTFANDLLFSQKRIVGGNIVNINENSQSSIAQWHWVVALIDQNNSHFCGATLIAPQWLMTAAHCLYKINGTVDTNLKITAVFKQTDLTSLDINTLTREVSETIIYPEYDFMTDNNDIALLKLDTPITDIEPVSLPGIFIDTPVATTGTPASILGWGSTEFDSNNQLRLAQLPIADFQQCVWNYATLGIDINQNMLCGGLEQGGVDSCQGDSGGPLVIPHESGQGWKQLGIVSFGVGCAEPKFYGVYTRTSRYNSFIQTHTCPQPFASPIFSVQRDKSQDTITFNVTSSTAEYTGHRIYFAPYPTPNSIQHYDLSGTNSITTTIPDNQAFYAVAQSLQHNCSSEFSQVIVSQ